MGEPDPKISQLVSELLRLRGWKVVLAKEPREALQKILAESPDAILLDRTVAGTGETDVFAMLRRSPATCNIPVGFLVEQGDRESPVSAQRAGALLLIPKPLKAQHLLNAVGLLLSVRRRGMAA